MSITRLPIPAGTKFGYWSVLEKGEKQGYLLCKCTCGITKEVRIVGLKNGASTNCGCIQRLNWIKRNTKYFNNETSDEPFYRRWQEMRNRVLGNRYPIYHVKNIKICDRWLDDRKGFINFREDLYESYKIHLKEHGQNETTLDRMDNDGNYEPSNCQWATRLEQARNSDRWKNK